MAIAPYVSWTAWKNAGKPFHDAGTSPTEAFVGGEKDHTDKVTGWPRFAYGRQVGKPNHFHIQLEDAAEEKAFADAYDAWVVATGEPSRNHKRSTDPVGTPPPSCGTPLTPPCVAPPAPEPGLTAAATATAMAKTALSTESGETPPPVAAK